MKNRIFIILSFAAVLSLQVLPARAAELRDEPAPLVLAMAEDTQEEELLGNFMLTAYCDCAKCNGPNPGIDCFGNKLVDGTIAVDPKVIPLGTKVRIRGKVYTARDTGGKWVKGKHIDIYMKGHSRASKFGVQHADVYLVK